MAAWQIKGLLLLGAALAALTLAASASAAAGTPAQVAADRLLVRNDRRPAAMAVTRPATCWHAA